MKRFFFNKALRILLFTNSLVLFAGAMIGPIYALFVENIGGSLFDASITGGIFALSAGITTLAAGKYADKAKEEELIVVLGYIAIGLGFLLYMFIETIWALFAVQMLIGFGEAIYSPAFDKLYSKHITAKKAGREWGAWESLNYFSLFLGAVIGGFIVTKMGFNALFSIMALLCFISALYIFGLPRKLL